MKYIFYTLLSLQFVAGCKTSKNYLARSEDDNTVFEVAKSLKKHNNDSAAINALPVLYNMAQQRHFKKINSYAASADITRWDKLINEYNILQRMYEAIHEIDPSASLVTTINYQQTIYAIKQQAAEDYYNAAESYLIKPGRDNAKKAWQYYKKIDKWVLEYKDSKQKMDEAYRSAIVNVQINPIQDNSFFFNTGWGNYGYNYSNEYFQQTLVREMGGKNSNRYPARFYTDWEARRDEIQPDLVVDLTLRNMSIPRPQTNIYRRNVSKQIEVSRDTSGKPVYQTVYATVDVVRKYFTARAQMEVNISDAENHKNISNTFYNEDYRWEEENGSYSGDSRALSANDLRIINNSRFNEPRKEDILNELFRKIYPQVKNRIIYVVDW